MPAQPLDDLVWRDLCDLLTHPASIAQVQRLEAGVDRQAELATSIASIEDFSQRVRKGLGRATFAQKRHLVELRIDRVVLTNEEVQIRYVIPTSPRSEHIRFCHLRKDYFAPKPRPYRAC
jgi:site-specific DNA recombinase